ncbi:HigA family addiction module antitoxin [Ostreibacterium oceani]|uniref:HigA family addiction module antidote protein n=1 Tax=Ostreibacterium oceani TaxID=2654998 RepID=A0A6N7EVC4_9GAMM|nr:HigA family addiction module antitoxin [Ostreibacterium oceani]MPV85913.1 HigA family addiction module antidote protein [Ostreibacterium oceani]
MRMYNPPHPGEVLKGLYLDELGLSITDAATALGMTRAALSEIIHGKRGITPKTAIKLATAFGGSAESWLRGQMKYDLWQAEQIYGGEDVKKLVEQRPDASLK